jgi:hypothetical protein
VTGGPQYSGLPQKTLFDLGQLGATTAAAELLEQVYGPDYSGQLGVLLWRHMRGDAGTMPARDLQANLDAIRDGERVVSQFDVGDPVIGSILVVTEADRSLTTVMLPGEY